MHLYFFKLFFLVFSFVFIFTGCGDSKIKYTASPATGAETNTTTPDNNTTTPDTNETNSGQFIDAPVAGLDYLCKPSNTAGTTTADGTFSCLDSDDNMYFELGSTIFGPVSFSEVITPYTIFPDSLTEALNLARILQSLDSDGDMDNDVIVIDTNLEQLLRNDLNYSSADFKQHVEEDISGFTLVDANEAQSRLNASIIANGGSVDENKTLPVADAGGDISLTTDNISVTLDGSGSVADSYIWTCVQSPDGSNANIENNTSEAPTFTADMYGTYVVNLTVNKGSINEVTDTITISSALELDENNVAPVIDINNTISVYENQTDAFTATATDENSDTLSFYLNGTDKESFDINTSSGVVVFKIAPDYETKTSYTLTVSVSDGSLSDEQNITIDINNKEEVPQLTSTTLSVAENLGAGTTVGQVIIDSQGDDTITNFSITGTGSDKFSINSSGKVTTDQVLDYEVASTYNLSVQATNSIGDSSLVDLIINVTNIADLKPVLVNTTLSFTEDASISSAIGKVTVDTFGDTTVTSSSLTGTGSENFNLANDGTITLASGASIDYETKDQYNLFATLTNSVGQSNTVDVTMTVNDVLDEVAVIVNSTGSIDENATVGTTAATLTISYSGDSSITNISLSGTGNEYFSITNDGIVKLVSANVLNYEAKTSYSLTAVAKNTAGDSNTANITISVGDVDEVPKLVDSTMSIMENKISGAYVGTITIDDTSSDSGDSAITAINLSGVGNENFICDVDGEVSLSSVANIDYETTPVYNLTAVATNTSGNSGSVNVTINIDDYEFDPTKIADLEASDAATDDNFGNSIAIDNDYILVGASFEDAGALSDGGSAYLYKKDQSGSLTSLSKLTANAPKKEEYFGHSIAMENGVMVIGAPDNNSYGGVYIYTIDSSDNISTPAQFLEDTSGVLSDGFGVSVAISGGYIVVGAPGNAKAYLYKLDVNNSASFVTSITSAGITSADNYGISVDIEGNYIVIGADKTDVSYTDDGSAYVYQLNTATDTVSSIGMITANTPSANDYFGRSVAISGNYLVAGAYGSDEVATNSGNAYLYKINSGSVSLVDTFVPQISGEGLSSDDSYGYNVSMDGEYIVLSAHKKDSGAVLDAGSVYLYHIDIISDSVTYNKKIDSLSQSSSDYFGSSVTIDGDFIGIGAVNDDSYATNAGKAFLYDGEPVP